MEPYCSKLSITKATIDDLPAITDIYNQAIAAGKCTCDMDLLTVEEHTPWFYSHNEHTPIFIAKIDDTPLGFAYISPYRADRKAVRDVCELSYYVDSAHRRKGIGSQLVRHCIAAAKENGYTRMLAILLSCNTASIAVLEKIGFQLWGSLPEIAKFYDEIRYNHLYYGLVFE